MSEQQAVNSHAADAPVRITQHIESLYIQYYRKLVVYCLKRMPGYMSAAEDCAHDTFVLLIKHIDKLKTHTNLPGWLYKTADNLSHKTWRDIRRSEAFVDIDSLADKITAGCECASAYENALSDEALLAHAQAVLDSLSDIDHSIYALYYRSGTTTKEIARLLGIREPACRVRLHRLRKRILRKVRTITRYASDGPA